MGVPSSGGTPRDAAIRERAILMFGDPEEVLPIFICAGQLEAYVLTADVPPQWAASPAQIAKCSGGAYTMSDCASALGLLGLRPADHTCSRYETISGASALVEFPPSAFRQERPTLKSVARSK